ncbi:MAG: CDP-archaeol synthase [Patescibacteria group bacterium]|nr:CDP-archaeol synthase [Patescibacteria group bacterium]MBU1877233.1 CDP-archaeol synthase [Patescibacteria group bacterium]
MDNFVNLILPCFYFFFPAYLTNMTPSLSATLGIFKFLAKPIDAGKQFMGKPLLGDHKTWRGIIVGSSIGIMIIFYQKWLFINCPLMQSISIINYSNINIWNFALSMTLGAIFGDLFFAFIKRRLDLKPGAKFVPFDQINYVLGAALFLFVFSKIQINLSVWLVLFVLTFILHVGATQIGYKLGLSKSQW